MKNEVRKEEIQHEVEEQRDLLELILQRVGDDAKMKPEAYLAETIVPGGGE